MTRNLEKKLASKLRKLRGNTSLIEFSQKLGISKSSLHRMEMGQQNVTLETLETLCRRLKCQVADLFDDESSDSS